MAPIVEKIEELGSYSLAEGPYWDEETKCLYFVDIIGKTVNKYVPALKKHTQLQLDKPVSLIIPIKDSSDRFIISQQREIAILTWDGQSSKPTNIEIIAVLDNREELANNRINDGKADPLGNLWAGTMAINADVPSGPVTGSLYSLDFNKKLKSHIQNVNISNGLAWSKDLKKMYYIDSPLRRIDQFDFDVSTISISNRQPLFTFEKHQLAGFPDGQTIDAEGNLWVAVFHGQRIIKIDTKKTETLLFTVEIPDHQVTSVTFGGPNLDELFVTTAGKHLHNCSSDKPVKGHIYKVTGLDAKGLPGNRVKI